jgi:hypothetical protein
MVSRSRAKAGNESARGYDRRIELRMLGENASTGDSLYPTNGTSPEKAPSINR